MIDQEIIKLDLVTKKVQFSYEKFISKYPMESFKENDFNFLIDLLIFRIFPLTKIEGFYTTLSGLLIQDFRNVLKFFKIISLFGICLAQFDKREDFIGSLLFVAGGVLRDIARCYLKTKGVFNENLSYHKCTRAKGHDTHFFPAKILLEKECDYFQSFGIKMFKNLIEIIIENRLKESYWDDYISMFNSISDKDEDLNSDIESEMTKDIKMIHYLYLFISDFFFFFMSNFTTFEFKENSLKFLSKFENVDEFVKLSLDLFCLKNHNFFNVWSFCNLNQRFLEIECEKTEYTIKDKYNTYGICLVFLTAFFRQYSKNSLPLLVQNKVYAKTFNEVISFILKTENEAEYKFYPQYLDLCYGIAKIFNAYNYNKLIEENELSVMKTLFENGKLDENKIKEIFP